MLTKIQELETEFQQQTKPYEDKIKKATEALASVMADADALKPFPTTIRGCKRKIELTKKAIFLGFIEFEKDLNPNGHFYSHKYGDKKEALLIASKRRLNEDKI